ncbi:hypothetical protein N7524_007506, partial [Penicillium chrysogenum]
KIRELLVVYGIGDCNDEPIKQHILAISNFVHDQRLQVGLTDPPPIRTPRHSPTPNVAANEKRGLYRFLSTLDKRGRPDYTGLDGSSTKNKRRCRDRTKGGHIANDMQKAKSVVVTQEGGTPVLRPSMSEKPAEIGPCVQLQALSN